MRGSPVVGHRFTMDMGTGWPGLLARIGQVLVSVSGAFGTKASFRRRAFN
ncbi:hypothetical protein [Paenarthrobacter nitroguajacolicus]|nr:hypothetical protein [Paenarthrobacter nitroguajacolicus]